MARHLVMTVPTMKKETTSDQIRNVFEIHKRAVIGYIPTLLFCIKDLDNLSV